jgi:hypothetical protein
MTAKQKIEELTNGWYGFALFAGLISLVKSGIGVFTLFFIAGVTLFNIALAWFLGRRLVARSSLTRLVLIVVSVLSTIAGVLGIGNLVFGSWSFGTLLDAALLIGSLVMNLRSFRTLTGSTVKTYFASA